MAIKKAVFSITCDSNGMGYDDVRLKAPASLSRPTQLLAVSVDKSAAFSDAATFTIVERTDVSAETWNDTAEDYAYGDQVYHMDRPLRDGPVTVTSIENVVDSRDTALSTTVSGGGIQFIRTTDVRGEINGGASGDVFTVTAYYETAGDYRF